MHESELLGLLDFVQGQLAKSLGLEVTSKATIELTEVEEVTV